jgi:hypothetical protein
MGKENDANRWIEEKILKYKEIDALRGTEHGITVAIAIFGKALVEEYLKDKYEKQRNQSR